MKIFVINIETKLLASFGHFMPSIFRANSLIQIFSGLVKVMVTSPAGLVKFFLNGEPCIYRKNIFLEKYISKLGV